MSEHINRRIAVHRNPNFIYFRIPKAANSTVIRCLTPTEDDGRFKVSTAKDSFLRPSDLSRNEVRHLRESFFLFSVVRNPYSRVLSAYLDKIASGKRRQKFDEETTNGRPDNDEFTRFCRYLRDGGIHQDAHWCAQVDLIPCGPGMLHRLGRTETLTKDLPAIIGGALGHPPTHLESYRPHQTNADAKLTEFYSRESAGIVRQLYARDFEAFDYVPDPDWLHALD